MPIARGGTQRTILIWISALVELRGGEWVLSGVRWALGDQIRKFIREILASGVKLSGAK